MSDVTTQVQELEAILFFKGEPVKIPALADMLGRDKEDVEADLETLARSLEGRGIRLVREGAYAGLATAPQASSLIEKIRKEELEGPLGKAGLETLAIIIYQGASTRADVEYIRGVNCSSILRTLTMRGLVERVENPNDKRSFLYRATPEVPAVFGVARLEDLPNFEEHKRAVEETLRAREIIEDEGSVGEQQL